MDNLDPSKQQKNQNIALEQSINALIFKVETLLYDHFMRENSLSPMSECIKQYARTEIWKVTQKLQETCLDILQNEIEPAVHDLQGLIDSNDQFKFKSTRAKSFILELESDLRDNDENLFQIVKKHNLLHEVINAIELTLRDPQEASKQEFKLIFEALKTGKLNELLNMEVDFNCVHRMLIRSAYHIFQGVGFSACVLRTMELDSFCTQFAQVGYTDEMQRNIVDLVGDLAISGKLKYRDCSEIRLGDFVGEESNISNYVRNQFAMIYPIWDRSDFMGAFIILLPSEGCMQGQNYCKHAHMRLLAGDSMKALENLQKLYKFDNDNGFSGFDGGYYN